MSVGVVLINDVLCFDKSKVAENINCFLTTIVSAFVNISPADTCRYGIDHVTDFYQWLNITENVLRLGDDI